MSTAAVDTAVPLTAYQKMWLASRFIPVIFFMAALIFVLTVLPNLIGQPLPPLLPVFLIVVLLVLIYGASKSLRDLLSGVALVEDDELVKIGFTHESSDSSRYGKFARLGRLKISGSAYKQAHAGQTYRICYSPASRIVWSLEPNAYWSSVIGKN
ncbi:MAG: hypothetical protein GC179_03725 [Anaerolineaceae bacterium]|nr:hypothetical protein [Anaerolineaceae bacterium]